MVCNLCRTGVTNSFHSCCSLYKFPLAYESDHTVLVLNLTPITLTGDRQEGQRVKKCEALIELEGFLDLKSVYF